MDYERENAKEWQLGSSSRPQAGIPGSDVSDGGFEDGDHAPEVQDTNEAVDDGGSSWQQVMYKKRPAKTPAKPATKAAAKQPANPAGKVSAKPSGNPPVNLSPRLPTKMASKSPSKPAGRPTIQVIGRPHNNTPLPPGSTAFAQTSPAKFPANPPTKLPHPPVAPQPLPKPRMVTFSYKNDNPARAAFRAQEPHNSVFVLSKACYHIEPDRKRMYDVLEEIGVRLGSFVRPPQNVQDCKLLIWGNQQQISETTTELQTWVQQSNVPFHTTKGGAHFAKTGLLSQDKAKSLDKKMEQEATQQKYQRVPDKSLTSSYNGYFLWPVDEIRPEDLLGPSYEALDPIRMDYSSYIIFDNHMTAFKILTDKEDGVREATKRIGGTMKEFVARNSREITVHMVERPDAHSMRKEVMVVQGPDFGQGTDNAKIPLLTGKALAPSEQIEWEKETELVEDAQFIQWRRLLGMAIKRLRYYRGRIQMRVLLGTFALTTFRRWPEGINSILFDRFLKDMDLSATKGRMIKDLQVKAKADVLLAYIHTATGIFAPADALTTRLEDVSPVYTARFEFDIPTTGKVQLEVQMGRPSTAGELYEITQSQWTRKSEKVEAVHPIEVFMIRLLGGISWEFQVSSFSTLDSSRITPVMTKFVNSIRFKPPPNDIKPTASGHRVFTWTSTLPVVIFEQKTALRYRMIDNSDWVFEFARYDTYSGAVDSTPTGTHWGGTFWNSEWDRVLGINANLEIGKEAPWAAELETFFPSGHQPPISGGEGDGKGLKQFLAYTKAIVELLDGMKVQTRFRVVK